MFYDLLQLGLIWFIVPVSMIVCNDVMAYLFGFFFGRTPLIKLSPKKTWEGFIGGGFATVIFGVLFSYLLCQYQYFICPIEYNETTGRMGMECEPSYLFRPQEYTLPLVSDFHFIFFPFYLFDKNKIKIFIILNFLGKNEKNDYDVSIFVAFTINECVQFSYWSIWWILCIRV